MAMFQIKITPSNKELREAIGSISAYDGAARLRIENAVEATVKDMSRTAKQLVPVNTGRLKKSIFWSFHRKDVVGYFGAKAPYAHLVELGIKKEVVEKPKDKRALMITAASGIQYAASAKIPARGAHPFIRPAYDQGRPEFIRRLKEAVQPK